MSSYPSQWTFPAHHINAAILRNNSIATFNSHSQPEICCWPGTRAANKIQTTKLVTHLVFGCGIGCGIGYQVIIILGDLPTKSHTDTVGKHILHDRCKPTHCRSYTQTQPTTTTTTPDIIMTSAWHHHSFSQAKPESSCNADQSPSHILLKPSEARLRKSRHSWGASSKPGTTWQDRDWSSEGGLKIRQLISLARLGSTGRGFFFFFTASNQN